jgi:hypothetical protein
LRAPSSSGGNGTLTLTLTLSGADQENATLWSMDILLNRSILASPSPAIMWNGTHTMEVPSTAHIIAGQRFEIILDEVYSSGGPPPAGEPITNELRIFLVAS